MTAFVLETATEMRPEQGGRLRSQLLAPAQAIAAQDTLELAKTGEMRPEQAGRFAPSF